MNIKQIITDYIMKSILETQGDMVVRGATVPEKLAAPAVDNWLRGVGVGNKPTWTSNLGGVEVHGDLIVRGASVCTRLAAVAVGQVLKSGGVGAKPVWGVPSIGNMNIATGEFTRTTVGDEVVTGLGFQPALVFFLSNDTDAALANLSVGIDNNTLQLYTKISEDGTGGAAALTYSISIHRSAGNILNGAISAMGAGGFTVTFALVGTVSADVTWLAIG